MADNSKPVDILVVGATGFTGKLIVRYLHAHRERSTFTLGVTARSTQKLKQLAVDLGLGSDVRQVVLNLATSHENEVERVIAGARVVINTVGPFYPTSLPVARACAHRGVHYVDVTGETRYIRALISELDLLAYKTHTTLIPSCAVNSLPADVVAFLSARTIQKHEYSNGARAAVSHTQSAFRFGMSGGSAATALSIFSEPKSERVAASDPCVLSPVKDPKAREEEVKELGALTRWLGVRVLPHVLPKEYGITPPVATEHNVAIVQRTRGLLTLCSARHRILDAAALKIDASEDESALFADTFRYGESLRLAGTGTFFGACVVGAAILLGTVSLWMLPPLRWILGRILPAPGTGPSDELLENGFMHLRNITMSEVHPESRKRTVAQTTLHGKGDGYALSAVMASESALCLLSPEKLPPLGRAGGVLTPMSALGDVLLRRLAASGRIEIESEVLEEP